MALILEQLHDYSRLAGLRLIASDIDGTLTEGDLLSGDVINALFSLRANGIDVLLVTGRSAGWGHALAGYLPVVGVIAENGGVFISSGAGEPPLDLVGIDDWVGHRRNLAACYNKIEKIYPQIRQTGDNFSRLSDWTFGVEGLGQQELREIAESCALQGWGFTHSSVHCHIMDKCQEKGSAIKKVLGMLDSEEAISCQEVLTIGDSPNDSSMLDPASFPCSVGVKNIEKYLGMIPSPPAYLSKYPEAQGFLSVVDCVLKSRGG